MHLKSVVHITKMLSMIILRIMLILSHCIITIRWTGTNTSGRLFPLCKRRITSLMLLLLSRLGEAREDLYTLSVTENHRLNGTAVVFGELLNSLASSHHCESWKGLLVHMWNIMCLKYPKRSGIVIQGPPKSGKSALVIKPSLWSPWNRIFQDCG